MTDRQLNKLSLQDMDMTPDALSIARQEAARKLAPRKPAPRKAYEAPKPARRGFFARLFNI